jgi:hypothetical protein
METFLRVLSEDEKRKYMNSLIPMLSWPVYRVLMRSGSNYKIKP